MCNIRNFTSVCGKKPGGTKAFVFMIPASEITAFPDRKSYTAAGDTVTLDGAFTLVSTSGIGYWRKLEIDPNSGQLQAEPVGDGQAGGFRNRFSGFILGIGSAQKEAVNDLVGVPLVAIAPDRNGVYHVIGDTDDPAYLAPGGGLDSQQTVEGKPGIAFTVEASSADIMPTYDNDTNALNTTPAA